MAIGVEHGTYRAAERGEAEPVPEPLWERVRQVQGWRTAVSHATSMVLGTFHDDSQNAWEYLKEFSKDDAEHHALMRAVIYLGKQSTRYWGVADPEEERYCSTCRHVKPIEMFAEGEYNCKECVE